LAGVDNDNIIKTETIKTGECLEMSAVAKCEKEAKQDFYLYQYIEEAPQKKYKNYFEEFDKRDVNLEVYKISDDEYLEKVYFENLYLRDNGEWREIKYATSTEKISKFFDKLIRPAGAIINTSSTNNKDSWTDAYYPTYNMGTETYLYLENWGTGTSYPRRAYIYFTMPSAPASSTTITSIKLFLYKNTNYISSGSYYYEIHELTRDDWSESYITWNRYKSGTSWTTAGGDYSATVIDKISHATASGNWDNWVIYGTGADNPLVKTWGDKINLILKIDSEDKTDNSSCRYVSKEYTSDTTKRPYIEITYSIATTTMAQNFIETDNIQSFTINATSSDAGGGKIFYSYSGSSPFFLFLEVVICIFLFFYLFFKFREIAKKKKNKFDE
jgi:hypothetical protein